MEKEKILGFLREGRLEVDKDSARSVLNCRICGTPISRGRICMDCLQKFKQSQAGGAERELDYENRRPGSSRAGCTSRKFGTKRGGIMTEGVSLARNRPVIPANGPSAPNWLFNIFRPLTEI